MEAAEVTRVRTAAKKAWAATHADVRGKAERARREEDANPKKKEDGMERPSVVVVVAAVVVAAVVERAAPAAVGCALVADG